MCTSGDPGDLAVTDELAQQVLQNIIKHGGVCVCVCVCACVRACVRVCVQGYCAHDNFVLVPSDAVFP